MLLEEREISLMHDFFLAFAAVLRTGEEVTILNPAQVTNLFMIGSPENNAIVLCHLQFPEGAREYYEPIVLGTLVFPAEYLGKIIKLCEVSFLNFLHKRDTLFIRRIVEGFKKI